MDGLFEANYEMFGNGGGEGYDDDDYYAAPAEWCGYDDGIRCGGGLHEAPNEWWGNGTSDGPEDAYGNITPERRWHGYAYGSITPERRRHGRRLD